MTIINTFDQNREAGGHRIIVFYRPQVSGRGYRSAAWQIGQMKNGVLCGTDPKAAWYDHGFRTFDITSLNRSENETLSEQRKRILQDAINWANIAYGAREFVKNRCGDYVEKEVNEKFPIPRRS